MAYSPEMYEQIKQHVEKCQCCVGKKHNGWCERDGYEAYIEDEDGNKYCIFHAPAHLKLHENGGEMTGDEFNELVFQRIQAVIDMGEEGAEWDMGSYWDPFSPRCDFSGTILPFDLYFEDFGEDNPLPVISFNSAQFRELVDFNSAQFRELVDFNSAQFRERVYFEKAQFRGEADFQFAQFRRKADFQFAQFREGADFSSAQFREGAYFESAQFREVASFESAQFRGNVYFESAQFRGMADLFSAQFRDEAFFISAHFRDWADFKSVQFRGEAGFQFAQFRDEAFFNSAQFREEADFNSSQFRRKSYFESAQFRRKSYFESAQFRQRLYFQNALVCNGDFEDAQFRDQTFFNNTAFGEHTSFIRARMKDVITFDNCRFGSRVKSEQLPDGQKEKYKADFEQAYFENWAYFRGTQFDEVSFNGVITDKTILLENADISRMLFAQTNIESFQFVECNWMEPVLTQGYVLEESKERRSVYDERQHFPPSQEWLVVRFCKAVISLIAIFLGIHSDKSKRDVFIRLEEIYRRLKKVARLNNDEISASAWHYKEKDMLRKRVNREQSVWFWLKIPYYIFTPDNLRKHLLQFFLNFYWFFCGYNEEPLRALVWLVVLLLAPFGYYLGYLGMVKDSQVGSDNLLQIALWYIPYAKIKLPEVPLVAPDGMDYLIKTVYGVVVTVFAALFGVSLRNKLRR